MNPAATIKRVLPQGDPQRVRTAESPNGSGRAIARPRTDPELLIARPELPNPGVHVLLRSDPEAGDHAAHTGGVADPVAQRPKQRKVKKSWASAIAFVGKDETKRSALAWRQISHQAMATSRVPGRQRLRAAKRGEVHNMPKLFVLLVLVPSLLTGCVSLAGLELAGTVLTAAAAGAAVARSGGSSAENVYGPTSSWFDRGSYSVWVDGQSPEEVERVARAQAQSHCLVQGGRAIVVEVDVAQLQGPSIPRTESRFQCRLAFRCEQNAPASTP